MAVFNFFVCKNYKLCKMAKTSRSDGPEQHYLERLFREKQVKGDMKPAAVQKTYPLFHGFSTMVFRKHWGQTGQTKQMFNDTCKAVKSIIKFFCR